ncbi:MAG: hypothetical protein HMLKMBBP_03353 [Planctomycetes bacterium]|nr:hypothetical protein [Planctomycetota bacterium]
MRRVAALVVAVPLLHAACGDVAAPPDAAPKPVVGTRAPRARAAPVPADRAPVPAPTSSLPGFPRPDLGSWTPSPDDLALAARLGDPERRDEAWVDIGNLPRDRYVAVLRAGLRLDDPRAAYQCATELSWRHLDAAEMSRVTRLVFEANFDRSIAAPDDPQSLSEVFEEASSADVAWLCDRLFATPGDAWPEAADLATLHKSLRIDALESVLRLAAHPTAHGNADIAELVTQLRKYTDGGRTRGSTEGPGLPSALADLLRRTAGPEGRRPDTATTAWALRWLADESPGPQDAALVNAVADEGLIPFTRRLLIFHRTAPAALSDYLTKCREEFRAGGADVSGPGTWIVTDRVVAGATGALPVGPLACGDAETLALQLAWDEAAYTREAEGLFRNPPADDPAGPPIGDMQSMLYESIGEAVARRAEYGIAIPDAVLARLAAAVGPEILGPRIPEHWARTVRLAESVAAGIAESEPDWGGRAFDGLGFLEVAAPEALRRSLRAASTNPAHDAHDLAREALARLGDGDALIARLASPPYGDDGVHRPLRIWRNAGPRVRAALAASVGEAAPADLVDGILALAICDLGKDAPPDLLFEMEWEEPPTKELRAAAALAIDGRPVDAILAIADLGAPVLGMGAVRDGRIGAWLRARLPERHGMQYATILAELTLHGDPEARGEFLRTVRAGHYRFVDDMHPLHRGMGDPLAAVPVWIDVVESNCCQKIGAIPWFEDMFEIDVRALDGPLETEASILRDWFATNGPRLRWSEIAGKFVVGPR